MCEFSILTQGGLLLGSTLGRARPSSKPAARQCCAGRLAGGVSAAARCESGRLTSISFARLKLA